MSGRAGKVATGPIAGRGATEGIVASEASAVIVRVGSRARRVSPARAATRPRRVAAAAPRLRRRLRLRRRSRGKADRQAAKAVWFGACGLCPRGAVCASGYLQERD